MNARTHFVCTVDGCNQPHDAKGFCHAHYHKWKRYGDPTTPNKIAQPGSGWLEKGYRVHTTNGTRAREHRRIVESVLGKPLPPGAVVHHVDENRLNNAHDNLVVCPSPGYHRLLHMRMEAYAATGHWDWMRCPYCHLHDDPSKMRSEKSGRFVHRECSAKARIAAYAKRRNNVHV